MRYAMGKCPACQAKLPTSESDPWWEIRCPRCLAELMCLQFSAGSVYFIRKHGESTAQFLGRHLGSGTDLQDFAASLESMDPFDRAELVADIESRHNQ